jgi:hypothetical protein
VIPPRTCETESKAARLGVRAPTRAIPRETAGLKRPPETRKKIQALTAKEKPKQREMYNRFEVSTVATVDPSSPLAVSPVMELVGIKATLCNQSRHSVKFGRTYLVPPRAKIINNTVPTYSPNMAMKSIVNT